MNLRLSIYTLLGLVVLGLPFLLQSNYWIYMFTIVIIYMMLVGSLDLVYGFTGLVSLGHAAFFGIGAYAHALLQIKAGFLFVPALIGAAVVTAIAAAIIGWPMLRIKGPYFALGTLALGSIIAMVIHNWDSFTGGVSLSGIPMPPLLELGGVKIDFASRHVYYYFVLFFLVLSLFLIRRLTNSRTGRAFGAIRDNEELAAAIGVNVSRYKIISYVIASTIAGVAGGLYATYMGAIEPEIAGSHMAFNLLVMIVVGGARTITGVIIGPLLLWFVPEFLEAAEAYRPLFFGGLLLIVISRPLKSTYSIDIIYELM